MLHCIPRKKCYDIIGFLEVAVTIAEQASPASTLWRSDWVIFDFNGFAKEILIQSSTQRESASILWLLILVFVRFLENHPERVLEIHNRG